MEQIRKTKKIAKQNQKDLSSWLRKITPWDTIKPQQQINVFALCRQLLFPRPSTKKQLIIKKLAYKYFAKWKAIEPIQRDSLMRDNVRRVARRNARLYWQWAPTEALRRDPLTLSYLCVKMSNKCFYCGYHLVPFGRARQNGADHDDWIGRKEHKKCWLKWKRDYCDR